MSGSKPVLIAHARKKNANEEWDTPQLLVDHLKGTGIIAGSLAREFGLEKIGRLLGLAHDAGKASNNFQKRIRIKSGYEAERFKGQMAPLAPHSDSGAKYVSEKYGPTGKILAYCIAGHHGGLPNGLDATETDLTNRLKREVEEYKERFEALNFDLPKSIEPKDFMKRKGIDGFSLSFMIRMLFSCLVDADYLDTENYMSPEKSCIRSGDQDFRRLLECLNSFIEKKALENKGNPLSEIRASILAECRAAAESKPGIFSLTVPTGGGKTLSSMAFALTHALKNGKNRIIYSIPFTSIIEQNAGEFREALGENAILEHHSNIDPDDRNYRNKLASENWDIPVVVTTNVQFFESLFAYKPSKCRKLHNIANSVIILDEAQMLSPDYLRPTLRAIKELVEAYNCSIVLCTATQPALNHSNDFKDGLENVREIISDPRELYRKLQRVKMSIVEETLNIDTLAERVAVHEQVLCILNTKRNAHELYLAINDKKGLYHLSTFMCAAHRASVIKEVRQRLDRGERCRVVSTQLIEAGVNVDFPIVYRAESGTDSIAQAAGRCNREGKINGGGDVFVFRLEARPPTGILRQSADEGNKIIKMYGKNILSLDAVHSYFEGFYWKREGANGLDKKGLIQTANEDFNPNFNFSFRDMARDYCLIDNNSYNVIIPWQEGHAICNELKGNSIPDRHLLRRLQRYVVQVRREVLRSLLEVGAVVDIYADESVFLLENEKLYDPQIGLNIQGSLEYDAAALIV